ncbi:DUF3857 domain-containing transglutaminase family protein [Thermodesulfobacteriota bacterium]
MILSYFKKFTFYIITLFTLTFILSVSFCAAEVIVLDDDTKIEDNIIKMEDGVMHLKKGGELKRDKLKDVYFSTTAKEEEKESVAVDKDEIAAIIKKGNDFEKKFPGYNGLVLLDSGYYQYNEDGTQLYRYHYQFKVLKDVTKREANVTNYFVEGRERIKITLARTIAPDGTVYNLDPAKIKISTPTSGSRSFSRYNTLSFMLPNVEVGSIIEYIMEEDKYNPFNKRFFFPKFGFSGDNPVSVSKLTISIPKDEKLYYVFKNFDEERKTPKTSEADGTREHIWQYDDIEPVIYEPNMPAYADTVPYISCSLTDEWESFFDWIKGFVEKKIVVTDEITSKVNELTAGLKSDDERVAAIYHYIQQKIRYISIKSGIGSGYSGHPAKDTLKNEYGDCIDKAILFTTMLKVLDIESYPIILKTNDSNDMERRLPGFDSNHAITKIVLDGREFFLDATAEKSRYPSFQSVDHGVWVINPLKKKLEFIDTPPPEDNSDINISRCSINENGDFIMDTTTTFTGQSESDIRYYANHIKDRDMQKYFVEFISSMASGSKLKYFGYVNANDISKPFSLELGMVLKNYGITAGDLVILSIPGLEKTFREVGIKERKFPLEFMTSSQSKNQFIIDLGNNFTAKYLPEPLNIDTEYFSYKYNMEYKEENGKLIVTEDYKRKKREVPLSEYEEYKKAHKLIERRLRDKIFLSKIKN